MCPLLPSFVSKEKPESYTLRKNAYIPSSEKKGHVKLYPSILQDLDNLV
jgi:hypothetical protein